MQRSTLLVISGILMIIASIVSIYLGVLLLNSYNSSVAHAYYIYYSSLYVGILNLIAFPLELISGAVLLTKKVRLSVIIVVAVLIIGLASPLILHFEGYLWETGLLFGSPMIVFSAIALALAFLGHRSRSQVTAKSIDTLVNAS
jgi:hypothetical protein